MALLVMIRHASWCTFLDQQWMIICCPVLLCLIYWGLGEAAGRGLAALLTAQRL